MIEIMIALGYEDEFAGRASKIEIVHDWHLASHLVCDLVIHPIHALSIPFAGSIVKRVFRPGQSEDAASESFNGLISKIEMNY